MRGLCRDVSPPPPDPRLIAPLSSSLRGRRLKGLGKGKGVLGGISLPFQTPATSVQTVQTVGQRPNKLSNANLFSLV